MLKAQGTERKPTGGDQTLDLLINHRKKILRCYLDLHILYLFK